ncbi:MAG TPA: carboxymuconolactone decarboxylase family protein, partial [Dongiaceae bacterium]|nr:carboxymuconolactone decarboxylase family protein [Dongiaceae bacterium]
MGAAIRPTLPLLGVALAAARGDAALPATIARARRAGWPRAALEEIALMLTLYAGYPSAIEMLRVLQAVWPAPAPGAGEAGPGARRARGLATLARVYGPLRPRLLRGLATLHPALAAWVIEHGYGRVLARARLDLRTRELVTVAMLAAGGWERQLVAHELGARRAGATRAQVQAARVTGARTRNAGPGSAPGAP